MTSDNPSQDKGTKNTSAEMKDAAFFNRINVDGAFTFNESGYPILAVPTVEVTISTVPEDAVVKVIQGNTVFEVIPDTDLYLLPLGTYTVSVEAENHITKTQEFEVSLNTATHILTISLEKEPDEITTELTTNVSTETTTDDELRVTVPSADPAKTGDSFDNGIFALFTIALISVSIMFTHKKKTALNK